jgi:hypothetical protein
LKKKESNFEKGKEKINKKKEKRGKLGKKLKSEKKK